MTACGAGEGERTLAEVRARVLPVAATISGLLLASSVLLGAADPRVGLLAVAACLGWTRLVGL